ncbi:poly-beta-1,6-N-acetyl-D-glucosamine biosynthesis protein PgaD [Gulbenkiania indica]|uniref:Poly-beta-1,6-N-acetyl-D-glucosamine biosynthesis protein PgaD n=2 Tax=Gulbenkiania TaxID=397456 RepID=A0A0K6GW33_9NEIS|nr:poly-beta-1,6-N-acetyl-D-glucosamine biosynthesis protein PgaD [Gulbenkiania indica]TCW30773.1 poly-beta-1,6-N-acetyl-D-glucosamine biosynthesis protein PgaD [Gulbenkiania mobilis]CUA82785.1 poly-beta-1,6-N-acetyl-D-glucosamine biosynthesis protein PgaD [Gulbenkiania indica]
MSDNLIINARDQLSWSQRLLSNASTAALWAGWLYLWRPFVNFGNWVYGFGANYHSVVLKMAASLAPGSLEHSVYALVGTSGTLLLWSRLPARRVSDAQPSREITEYASHFGLPEEELAAAREASITVVHHDDHGRIIRIERRA